MMRLRRLLGFLNSAAGVRSIGAKCQAVSIFFVFATALSAGGRAQTTATVTTVESEQPPLPSWLKSGTVRFARFDGGPIETKKALRSAWAAGFSPQDLDVLTNLYGTPGDRMIDLYSSGKDQFCLGHLQRGIFLAG